MASKNSKLFMKISTLCLVILLFFSVVSFHRNNVKSFWSTMTARYAYGVSLTMRNISEVKATTTIKPTTEVYQTKPVLILWWSKYFGNEVACDKPIPRSKICNNTNLRTCSVSCEITNDRKRAANASVMIISARDPSPLPPQEYSHIPLTLFTWENPVYTPTLSNEKFVSNFNYLMSYRPDLADFYIPSFDTPTVEPKPIPFANKTGLIAAVFSNCESARTAYLRELMKHIHVDSYGDCLRNKQSLKARYSKDFKQIKTQMLRNYKFTIVFHNQDCDYFVDDQLTHALNAGTVPVFMGTDKVDELLGGNLNGSIIKVRNFDTPKKLAEFLTKVGKNETLYNKYLKWKYEGFQLPDSFKTKPQGRAMIRTWLTNPQYCDMCEMIAKHRDRGEFKKKGSVKTEYCAARKISDWIKS